MPLPPLKEVISEYGLSPRKGLGQNFLLDLNLTRRIARAANNDNSLEGMNFLEIGAGPGGLTRALFMEGASHLTTIERDARCIGALEEIGKYWQGRLTIVHGDALEEQNTITAKEPYHIIANLPYNISTPLLIGWLQNKKWPPPWQSMTLLFQQEVAKRILAETSSRAYGRISVQAQWRYTIKKCFDIDPRAFLPVPKITSSLLHFTPKIMVPKANEKWLYLLLEKAFGQRRKMLGTSLKGITPNAEKLIEEAGLDAKARPQDISPSGFCTLSLIFAKQLG